MKKVSTSLKVFLFIVPFFLSSCGDRFSVDLSAIPSADIHIVRYEMALFQSDLSEKSITDLQQKFPLFLGDKALDSVQVSQLKSYVSNPYLKELYSQTETVFPNLQDENKQLSDAFMHIKYYYPNFSYPIVYSYISGSQDQAFYQDQVVMLSLDRYLGSGNEIYQKLGTPKYKQFAMQKSFLIRDVLMEIAQYFVPPVAADTKLLEQMVYQGKLLYFIKSMAPDLDEKVLYNQTSAHLNWFDKNENELWRYYIENELLYKSDYIVYNKFINDAPFTAVLGDDAAPRTGIWLGYQIVLSYMDHHKDLKFNDLMNNTDAQSILQKSFYKPGK